MLQRHVQNTCWKLAVEDLCLGSTAFHDATGVASRNAMKNAVENSVMDRVWHHATPHGIKLFLMQVVLNMLSIARLSRRMPTCQTRRQPQLTISSRPSSGRQIA